MLMRFDFISELRLSLNFKCSQTRKLETFCSKRAVFCGSRSLEMVLGMQCCAAAAHFIAFHRLTACVCGDVGFFREEEGNRQ